jgi:hypothetical protein
VSSVKGAQALLASGETLHKPRRGRIVTLLHTRKSESNPSGLVVSTTPIES